MRLVFSLFLSLLLSCHSFGQEIVTWNNFYDISSKKIEMTASMKDGWHIYSLDVDESIGPIATSFEFETSESYEVVGGVNQPEPLMEYDANFEGDLRFFENEVTFTQEINVKKKDDLKVVVTFMVCNAEMCLPPVDQEFIIKIEK